MFSIALPSKEGSVFFMQKETTHNKKTLVNIFEFDNFRDFLMAAGFPHGNYNARANTLQKWANRLGYKSPSSLNMVLKGSRLPSREMQRALIKDLSLNNKESEFFELMIEKEKGEKRGKFNSDVHKKLDQLSGGRDSFQMPLKEFSLVSKWYFLVIKQLVSAPGFIDDVDWIHRKLRKRVSQRNIRYALQTLEELGLIERDSSGELRPTGKSLKLPNGPKSAAIQSHHGGMIEQGFHALTELPVEKRQISGITMRMPTSRMEEAQDFLFKFLEEFDQKFHVNDSEDVYQLNMQFFPHTNEGVES